MRTALTILALTAIGSAEVKDDKLVDSNWNFTYTAKDLKEGIAVQQGSIIFVGSAAEDVQIELIVLESPKKQDGAAWRKQFMELRRKAKIQNVEESKEGLAWVLYTQLKLEVFNEHHGYAFYPRGHRCMVVHAYMADKSDTSGKRIKECLKGFQWGEGDGISLREYLYASRNGLDLNDPGVTLIGGQSYLDPSASIPPIAVQVLTRALENAKPNTYSEVETFDLYHSLGFAFLVHEESRDTKKSIEWFTKAEEAAQQVPAEQRVDRQASAAYNLACAYALDGQVDKAFVALDRAFADKLVVSKEHLSKDPDLNSLRKDQARWDKFWKERVADR
ncbi:MAG: hypothetical protein AAGD14_04265 [Planctomycetota bacterium]